MNPISTKQIRMMRGLARKAGIDNEDLHAMVYGTYEKGSIKQLTSYEGKKLIDRLLALCGEEPKESADRATGAQQAKIYALARELGWGDDPRRLRSFLKARFGVESVNWLPAEKAGPVIEALKAMLAGCRGERKRGVKG